MGIGLFLKHWARGPRHIGAIVPSSRFLASAMAAQVDPSREGVVVELGAGTGMVTRALRQRILAEKLLIIERNPHFHTLLIQHFPELRIILGDAAHLSDLLGAHGVTQVNAFVSSLPLLSLPGAAREAILGQLVPWLSQGTELIQFTYGPASPLPPPFMEHYKLRGERRARIWFNLPPAHVWRYHSK